jgi:hypothetical protein
VALKELPDVELLITVSVPDPVSVFAVPKVIAVEELRLIVPPPALTTNPRVVVIAKFAERVSAPPSKVTELEEAVDPKLASAAILSVPLLIVVPPE